MLFDHFEMEAVSSSMSWYSCVSQNLPTFCHSRGEARVRASLLEGFLACHIRCLACCIFVDCSSNRCLKTQCYSWRTECVKRQ